MSPELGAQLLAVQRMWERSNAHLLRDRPGPSMLSESPSKSNRGRRPKPLIVPSSSGRPPRATDEALMALDFFLHRLEGQGWELAAGRVAADFGLATRMDGNTRAAESRVERAAEHWRGFIVPYLIELFPEHRERLRELLRERSR